MSSVDQGRLSGDPRRCAAFGAARGVANGQVHRAPTAADDPGHHRGRPSSSSSWCSRCPAIRWPGVAASGPARRPTWPKFRAEHNLDKPLIVQYLLYMGNLLQGDLGTNFYGNSVVRTSWRSGCPTTIKLAVMAIIIEIVIGISAGVLAGIRRGKFIDHLVTVSTLVLISIPIFVIGSLAQLIFGVKLGWFPVTATQGTIYQLIMPAFVLASPIAGLRRPADADQPGRRTCAPTTSEPPRPRA